MSTFLSMRQYAKHRGVSPEAVSKAVRNGRISTVLDEKGNRKIDPVTADQEWPVILNDNKSFNITLKPKKEEAPKPVPRPEPEPRDEDEEVDLDPTPAAPPPPPSAAAAPAKNDNKAAQTYQAARAAREAFNSKLAKLAFEEKSGKLVDANEVEKRWISISTTVRTRVLGIPSKAKQSIPGMTLGQFKILESIVREALESLAEDPNEAVKAEQNV